MEALIYSDVLCHQLSAEFINNFCFLAYTDHTEKQAPHLFGLISRLAARESQIANSRDAPACQYAALLILMMAKHRFQRASMWPMIVSFMLLDRATNKQVCA